jgi:hypothetical protein
MKRFAHVVDILENAVNGETINAPHRNFWRGQTLDQFVALKIIGQQLIVRNDAANSALVKALRGKAPFGADVVPRPPGAIFRRMPAGRTPVPEQSIAFIEDWINAGCPDDEVTEPVTPALAFAATAAAGNFDLYNRFFRTFDDFFAFQADPATTGQDINTYFGIVSDWPGFIQSPPNIPNWLNDIRTADNTAAIKFLSDNQLRIMKSHFGDPLGLDALADAFWHFGSGDLPLDPLRPVDPHHRMNGASMWMVWLGFADACIRLGIDAANWSNIIKIISLGLVGDALFRTDRNASEKLKIIRYRADDPNVRTKVTNDFSNLSNDALLAACIGLGQEANFGAPVPAVA